MEFTAIDMLMRDPDHPGVNFELTDINSAAVSKDEEQRY